MSIDYLRNENGFVCLFNSVINLEDKDEPEGHNKEVICSNSRSDYNETKIQLCCDRGDPFKRIIYVYEIVSYDEWSYMGTIPSELVESIKQRASVPDSYFKIKHVTYASIHLQYFCKEDDIKEKKVYLNVGDSMTVGKQFSMGYSSPKTPIEWLITSVKYNFSYNVVDIRLMSKNILKLSKPENIIIEDYDYHVVSSCLDELAKDIFDETDYKHMNKFISPIFSWKYDSIGQDNKPIITYCENIGRIKFFSEPSYVRLPTIGDITYSRKRFPRLANEVISYLLMPQTSYGLLPWGDVPEVYQDVWFINDISFDKASSNHTMRSMAIKNANRDCIFPIFDLSPNGLYGVRPVIEVSLPNLLK